MSDTPQCALLAWYRAARRDLPWRRTKDPYRIWLSEIMLQQTRVETVKGYYARFLALFPTVEALASAPEESVLKAWEGLGYYSRARNLRRAAQVVTERYGGRFPADYEALLALPGVGAYTAGAVASIAFGLRRPAVDGNVLRVATRFFGVREDVGVPSVRRALEKRVADFLPDADAGDFNQALMELGATLCSPAAPRCGECPWREVCDARECGDMELLPAHEKKKPPKTVEVAVCLLFDRGRVLVTRRSQRLLNGLYVFMLVEDEREETRVMDALLQSGLDARMEGPIGAARHVFTHRIWEMTVYALRLNAPIEEETLRRLDGRMATAQELALLPLPTAMEAAKKLALEELKKN